jgi:hypothetical protein
MFRNSRSCIRIDADTHTRWRSPGIPGALLGLATALTLLLGDASAQARHYPLESTAGLRLVNATAEPATLDGKKGLRATMSSEAQARISQQPQAQRTTGEALVVIEGLEFANGIIEAEIAGAPAPGAPETARGFVGIAFRLQKRHADIRAVVPATDEWPRRRSRATEPCCAVQFASRLAILPHAKRDAVQV